MVHLTIFILLICEASQQRISPLGSGLISFGDVLSNASTSPTEYQLVIAKRSFC